METPGRRWALAGLAVVLVAGLIVAGLVVGGLLNGGR